MWPAVFTHLRVLFSQRKATIKSEDVEDRDKINRLKQNSPGLTIHHCQTSQTSMSRTNNWRLLMTETAKARQSSAIEHDRDKITGEREKASVWTSTEERQQTSGTSNNAHLTPASIQCTSLPMTYATCRPNSCDRQPNWTGEGRNHLPVKVTSPRHVISTNKCKAM